MHPYVLSFNLDGLEWSETHNQGSDELARAFAKAEFVRLIQARQPRLASVGVLCDVQAGSVVGSWDYDASAGAGVTWSPPDH